MYSDKILVTVSAEDEESGMPSTVTYKYNIAEDGEAFDEANVVEDDDTYVFTGLYAGTTYKIKIETEDILGNPGSVETTVTTLSVPNASSVITITPQWSNAEVTGAVISKSSSATYSNYGGSYNPNTGGYTTEWDNGYNGYISIVDNEMYFVIDIDDGNESGIDTNNSMCLITDVEIPYYYGDSERKTYIENNGTSIETLGYSKLGTQLLSSISLTPNTTGTYYCYLLAIDNRSNYRIITSDLIEVLAGGVAVPAGIQFVGAYNSESGNSDKPTISVRDMLEFDVSLNGSGIDFENSMYIFKTDEGETLGGSTGGVDYYSDGILDYYSDGTIII